MYKVKPILIQFTGPQGSGKTTLVKAFMDNLNTSTKVKFVGEVTRTLKKNNLIKGYDKYASNNEQFKIDAELLLQYFAALKDAPDIIVAERSAVCCMGYTMCLKEYDQYVFNFTERFLQATFDRKDVDVITFYTSPLSVVEDDGFRKKESAYYINDSILQTLAHYRIVYTMLPNVTLPERLSIVLKTLKTFNKELYKKYVK